MMKYGYNKDINLLDAGYYWDDETDELDYSYWSAELFADEIAEVMAPTYSSYLVYGRAINWRGCDGFKIVTRYEDCFYRDYDASLYWRATTSGGKACKLREYSHDVPTGCDVYIIGLTDKEAAELDGAKFLKVMRFQARYSDALDRMEDAGDEK